MHFPTFAAEQLSAIARTLSDAADAQSALATAAALASARADAEAALTEARAAADAALSQARAEADAILAMAQAEHEEALARVRAEADAAVGTAHSIESAAVDRVRAEAAAEIEQVKAAAALDLLEARSAADAALAELRRAAEAEVGALRSAADAAAQTNAAFGAMIDRLRNQQTQLAADNEQLAAENAALTYERADILERAQLGQRGPLLTRLNHAFASMAEATSPEAVLTVAAECVSVEFARVRILMIRDGLLHPTADRGFDPANGPSPNPGRLAAPFLVSASQAPPGAHAFRADGVGPLPFEGTPSWLVTAAIAVRGERVALIYADDGGAPSSEESCNERRLVLQLLAAHIESRLERLMIELKAATELRAYADMLIDELEYGYESDRSAGRTETERLTRLQENVRCARQIYQQRVTLEGPSAAALLDHQLARVADEKQALPFGRALRRAATPDLALPA